MCSLSLSLSDLRAQCPDYDFVFGDPVLNGSQWQIDLSIANYTTSQVLFKGVGLRLAVWDSDIDQDMTENSSDIPNVPSDQFTWPQTDAFIVGWDQNGTEVQVIPAATSSSEPGMYRLLTIYFTGDPGECYHAEFITQPANQFFINFSQGTSCFPLTYYLNPSEQPADSDDACYPDLIIAGYITKTTGMSSCTDGINYGVPDVDVHIDGINSVNPQYVTSTGTNGSYMQEIASTYQGDDLRISPEKENYPACGVTTLDVDLIKAFLLGYTSYCWTYPWQSIAADANMSGTISIADIVLLEKVVQGGQYTMESWTFIPTDEYVQLSTPYCNNQYSPTFDPYIDLLNFQSSTMVEDFVAVKVGDVDGSCEDCDNNGMFHDPGQEEEAMSRSDIGIELACSVQVDPDGSSHLVFRTTKDIQLGILTLTFAAQLGVIDWLRISGLNGLDDWAVNEVGGAIRLLYSNPEEYEQYVPAGEIILSLPISDGMDIGNLVQVGETWRNANTLNGEVHPVRIALTKATGSLLVRPNPARSTIFLTTVESGHYSLFNMQGLLVQQGSVQQGDNEIQLKDVFPGTYLIHVNGDVDKVIVK